MHACGEAGEGVEEGEGRKASGWDRHQPSEEEAQEED
jgi:hypothetical protein